MQRRVTRGLVAVVATAALGLMAATPAPALEIRPNTFSFGPDGTEPAPASGQIFGGPEEIVFDAPDRLYVANNAGDGTVDGIFAYDPTAAFAPVPPFTPKPTDEPGFAPGLALDTSGGASDGNIYLASQGTDKIYAWNPAGNLLWTADPRISPGAPQGKTGEGFLDLRGAAVDSTGTVWVSNSTTRYVLKYSSAGAYLGAIDVSQLGTNEFSTGQAGHLDFDSSDNLFLEIDSSAIFKLTPPAYDQGTATLFEGGSFPSPTNVTVNRANDHVFVTRNDSIKEYDPAGTLISTFGTNVKYGNETEEFQQTGYQDVAVNSATDEVYVTDSPFGGGSERLVRVFGPVAIVPDVTTGEKVSATRTTITVKGHVALDGGGPITMCKVQAGTTNTSNPEQSGFYDIGTFPCNDALPINADGDVTATITGVEPEDNCEVPTPPCKRQRIYYRIIAGNANGPDTGAHKPAHPEPAIKDIDTLPATNVGLDSADLHGFFDRDGLATNYYFQWAHEVNFFSGLPEYNTVQQSAPSPGPLAPSDEVHFSIPEGLEHGKTYYYRVVAENETGITYGDNESFYTSSEPSLDNDLYVDKVSTDQATIHLTANPNGLPTTYHIEYGTKGDCAIPASECISLPEKEIVLGEGVDDAENEFELTGLQPNTVYHYRVVVTNSKGTVSNTTDHFFKTFGNVVLPPQCPNDLVRQQTGAALLLDCRAFELVSAENTGGYDVESSLAPGQEPFGGYPLASNPSQVLYGIHNGAIPGLPGNPTNKGVDPYVATRGESGWATRYVGIPANGTPSVAPFASSLLAADSGLDTFAFGGPDICAPCFDDGSSGIPMRLSNGSLVQGMAGQLDPGALAAADGSVARPFSEDGSHFVFGSLRQYESDGNNNTGDVSIYDRNLATGETQVVSKDPAGNNLTCLQGAGQCHGPGNSSGISQLDISSNGSRIVVGQLVAEDGAGNDYHRLYMHIGDNPQTVSLTPGATNGAQYAGMTEDGSTVYFTTRDPLTTTSNQDTDTSADLFRATVSPAGSLSLSRVSTGTGSGNTDTCDPSGDSRNPVDWNAPPGAPTDCSVVAVGGGGGVASEAGTVYLLSPEALDGNGVDDSPNLFAVRLGGDPEYVTTLASNANAPFAPERHLVDYQLTGFSSPVAANFDHSNGKFYVMDNTGANRVPGPFVQRFHPDGTLDLSFGNSGKLDGSETPTGPFLEVGNAEGQFVETPVTATIGFDNTCETLGKTGAECTTFDPSDGSLYVPDVVNRVVSKFDRDGNYISQIDLTPILGNINVEAQGVAVDPTTGNVIVITSQHGALIFDNKVNNEYTGTTFTPPPSPVSVAVDGEGYIYIANGHNNGTWKYAPGGGAFTVFDTQPVFGIAWDPTSNHIYLDKGDRVEEYTTGHVQIGPSFGHETLENSVGLAAFNDRLVVSNRGNSYDNGRFTVFTEPRIPPDQRYDDSLVINGVNDAGARHTEDFQVTPDGEIATFASALPLTPYDPRGKNEIYRYDQLEDELVCASCPPTFAAATGDSTLASNGLNLTDDGRLFFTATEPLVLRDTNGKEDVYEWKDGEVQPISPGQDQFGSRLLTASADGVDVYFFTHATLVPQDRSGNNTKVYDARENGGFFVVPPQPPCVASDECHGPGTQAAPPPPIGSFGGTPTRVREGRRCRKGKVLRKGRCVKKAKKRRAKKGSRRKGRTPRGERG